MWETQVQSLGWKDPLEKEMTTHSSVLAWEILWTEEPGGLQSTWLQSQARLSDETTPTITSILSAVTQSLFWFQHFVLGKKKKKLEKDPKLQTPWKIIVIIHENWWCTNSKSQRFTLGYTYRHPVPHSHTSSRAHTWEGSEPLCSQWQEIGNDRWTH